MMGCICFCFCFFTTETCFHLCGPISSTSHVDRSGGGAFGLPLFCPRWSYSRRGWLLSVFSADRIQSEIQSQPLETSKMGSTCENLSSPLSYRFPPPATHLYCVMAHLCEEAPRLGVSSEVEEAGASSRCQGTGSPWSWSHIVLNPVQVISNLGIYTWNIFLPTAKAPADDANQSHVVVLHTHQGAT